MKKYVADFETTVYDGQESTEVWAAAICKVGTDNANSVKVVNSIDAFFEFIISKNEKMEIYFHNLAFDGMFILSYLMNKYKQAFNEESSEFKKAKELEDGEFTYLISSEGQWYSVLINLNGRLVRFLDSFKLIPLSVATIGESFNTRHRKLSIDYEGKRAAGQPLTYKERLYIINDVLVMSEALEIFFKNGYQKSTLASNALAEMKRSMRYDFQDGFTTLFPELSPDEDLYIRQGYYGGWVYVNPKYEGVLLSNCHGATFDINSLFPFVMHSISGNSYPIGKPLFVTDYSDFLNLENKKERTTGKSLFYYFVRFKCSFELKDGFLPFIQIKNNILYKGNEMLTTSVPSINRKKHGAIITPEGEANGVVELTLPCTLFDLFKKHYNISNFEFLDAMFFMSIKGCFDSYINRYMHDKETQTGGLRQIAKLFLNSAYGKFGTSPDSSFKVARVNPDTGILEFSNILESNKKTVYVAVAAAVTAYARAYTVGKAQADIERFMYSDTDSIHLIDYENSNLIKTDINDKKLGYFKIENTWDRAKFLRQKTYLEIGSDVILKCAGMSQRAKNNFLFSIPEYREIQTPEKLEEFEEYKSKCRQEEQEYLNKDRCYDDFKIGEEYIGNLKPIRYPGGIVLSKSKYKIKGGRIW